MPYLAAGTICEDVIKVIVEHGGVGRWIIREPSIGRN